MRIAVLFLGLTVLFGSLFPLLNDLFRYLPSELYAYPRKGMSNAEYKAIVVTLRWIVPAVVVGLFLWKAKISQRLNPGWGTKVFTIGTAVFVVQFALRYVASFIPGGAPSVVAGMILGHTHFPIKVMLFVGALHLLMTLKSAPAAQQSVAADAQEAARA